MNKKIVIILVLTGFALVTGAIFKHSEKITDEDRSLQLNAEKYGTIEIIEPAQLLEIIKDVSIIDSRKNGFSEGHIPSSQQMDWADWTEEKPDLMNVVIGNPTKWGKVEVNQQIQKRLQNLGLNHDKLIVIVGSAAGWGEEGRIAWNLLFWGAQRVALLDGGFMAWKQLGYEVEYGAPSEIRLKGDFKLTLNDYRRATLGDVKQYLKSKTGTLLDARSKKEFQGEKMYGQKRGGRLPGSKLIPFQALYQTDGKYISATELQKLLGNRPEGTPITYCTGGVRSALLALLIESRLGIKSKSYDGSLWEWSYYPSLPLN